VISPGLTILLAMAAVVVGVSSYIVKKQIHLWIISYLKQLFKPSIKYNPETPIDIMFLFVDHFELNGHQDRLDAWINDFPNMAKKHSDSDGRYPAHSFFYALDLMHEHELEALRPLMDLGFGEIEIHWHHSHDTYTSAHEMISSAMQKFHQHGFMTPSQRFSPACFAFIHGNWSFRQS